MPACNVARADDNHERRERARRRDDHEACRTRHAEATRPAAAEATDSPRLRLALDSTTTGEDEDAARALEACENVAEPVGQRARE